MHKQPSSTWPSQLSSMPLHVSVPALTAPTHAPHAPPAHVCVPVLHAPALLPQTRIAPLVQRQPSSTTPLQLSSITPSQSSVVGTTPPTQPPHAPLAHVWSPVLHAPTLLPHA